MSTHRLTDEDILSLGPSWLESRNPSRYQGQQERVTLEAFAPEDRNLLHRAYQSLLELYLPLRSAHVERRAFRDLLEDFVHSERHGDLALAMSHLGHATTAGKADPIEVQRLVHDLRGGAYQALSFRLQLLEAAPDRIDGLQTVYFLVRDHLKIMRNCVADLDPERFAADALTKDHDVNLLLEKWSLPEFNGVARPVQVDLRCHYGGTLCESCLEFSSLDRILYNLMNNAARFATDGSVILSLAGVPSSEPEAVRFVIANAVSPQHHAVMVEQFGDSPGELFRGGFTTGGHGVGARICADFCAHAFGLSSFDEALASGYFGAHWFDDVLATWFHWPIVGH